jgi:hypothetical protein
MSNATIPSYANEAAFPRPTQYREPSQDHVLLPAQWGLTKREYIAAKIMAALASEDGHCLDKAERATKMAEALLAELAKNDAAEANTHVQVINTSAPIMTETPAKDGSNVTLEVVLTNGFSQLGREVLTVENDAEEVNRSVSQVIDDWFLGVGDIIKIREL